MSSSIGDDNGPIKFYDPIEQLFQQAEARLLAEQNQDSVCKDLADSIRAQAVQEERVAAWNSWHDPNRSAERAVPEDAHKRLELLGYLSRFLGKPNNNIVGSTVSTAVDAANCEVDAGGVCCDAAAHDTEPSQAAADISTATDMDVTLNAPSGRRATIAADTTTTSASRAAHDRVRMSGLCRAAYNNDYSRFDAIVESDGEVDEPASDPADDLCVENLQNALDFCEERVADACRGAHDERARRLRALSGDVQQLRQLAAHHGLGMVYSGSRGKAAARARHAQQEKPLCIEASHSNVAGSSRKVPGAAIDNVHSNGASEILVAGEHGCTAHSNFNSMD